MILKAIKTAKKSELVNFKPGIVSINTPQIRHTKPETGLYAHVYILSDKKCFGTVAGYRYVDYVIVTVVLGAAP